MKNEKKRKNDSGGHLVFQNEAKIYKRHTFVDINLLCKFGEFMIVHNVKKGVMKPFIKCDGRTHTHKMDIGHFIISCPEPIGQREIKRQKKWYDTRIISDRPHYQD